MYKIAAILLSFTILIQSFNFDLEDFNKMPSLVNHFVSHYEKGDSISDFITMHYGDKANYHEKEHKDHKELPFKHQHLDSHFQLAYIFYTNNLSVLNNELFSKKDIFSYKESLTNSISLSIFQPPQRLHS
ncbi:hypothetical protein [Lutibacter citreus]|uniref:hypothetical protein n=1 Tax=Lutibacter citreus TaxID=2138210 RepID=UPI000DBE6676|nr:hypothetical protein [Lutibacter citreus]